jgi:phage-related minor tail protein
LQNDLTAAETQVTALQKLLNEAKQVYSRDTNEPEFVKGLRAELQKATSKRSQINLDIQISDTKTKEIENTLSTIAAEAIKKGYEVLRKSTDIALKQGALNIQKTLLQGLTGPLAARAQADIEVENFKLQIDQIRATQKLVETMEFANILNQERVALDTKRNLEEQVNRQGGELTPQQGEQFGKLTNTLLGFQRLREGKLTTKNIAQEEDAGVRAAFQTLQSTRQNTEARVAAANQGMRGAQAGGRLNEARSRLQIEAEIANLESTRLETLNSIKLARFENRKLLSDEEINRKQALERDSLSLKQEKELSALRITQRNLLKTITDPEQTERTRDAAKEDLKSNKEKISALERQQILEQDLLALSQIKFSNSVLEARENLRIEDGIKLQDLELASRSQVLDIQLQNLSVQAALNGLTEQAQLNAEKAIKSEQLLADTKQRILTVERSRNKELLEIDREIRRVEAEAIRASETADTSELQARRKVVEDTARTELEYINKSNMAKQQALDLQYSMTVQMKGYDQIFRNSIDRMADSIIEFAKTGKLNFKDMINSMLEDILRFELRQQTLKTYQGLGGAAGIFGRVAEAFGITTNIGPTGATFAQELRDNLRPLAKGGMFDMGVQQFAKGAMFTNQIVSQPTLFKFAQGTGLMGEAGPEAIMPLKRDQNGNLGVRSTQQNVEVVVNNYSNQQAETKETVDSRGNRKIEVIVGDMVAGEMGRKNSSMQQSLAQNFAAKPAIVRR